MGFGMQAEKPVACVSGQSLALTYHPGLPLPNLSHFGYGCESPLTTFHTNEAQCEQESERCGIRAGHIERNVSEFY